MSSRSRSTAASACCATRLSPRHEGDPAAPPRRPGGARICRGADPGSRRGQGAGQGRHNRRQHAGSAGGVYVFVVENGVVRQHQITEIRDLGTEMEVSEGVKAGNLVVVNPPVDLEDGKKVKLRTGDTAR